MRNLCVSSLIRVLFATSVAFISPSHAQPPSGAATLSGCVFRTEGAAGGDRLFVLPGGAAPAGCRPAAGAAVTAVGGGVSVSATASATGVFALSVPAGSYIFQAALTGCSAAVVGLTVPPGADLSLTAGDPPATAIRVTGATAQDPTTVDVSFSGPVANAAAGAFSIRPPLAVLGAQLSGSNTIRLVTAPQAGGATYVVTAANVVSADGRVLDPTHASAPFAGRGTGPQLLGAEAVDPMHVDLRFSVPVLAEGAANAGSYSFSPYLQVLSAAVLDDGRRVRLITSEQTAGALYTVSAYGVRDVTGTALAYGSSAPFTGMGQGPRVVSAQAVDDTHVDVRFDEEVDSGTGAQVNNYVISGLQVLGAWITGDARVVRLATSEGRAGALCRVLARSMRDRAGNVTAGSGSAADFTAMGTPPSVTSVYAFDSTHIEVTFSEPLDPLSLTELQAQITPALAQGEALLQADGRTVLLAVSEMRDGQSYNAALAGVRDRAGNPAPAAGNPLSFQGIGVAPRLVSAWVVDTTHVDARYSEAVSAAGNYSISPTVNVTGAAIQPDGKTVRLTTGEMVSGTVYTLHASAVTDLAGNGLDPSASSIGFGGAGGAPKLVSVTPVDSVTVDVLFSEGVSPASAEIAGNYVFSPPLSVTFLQLQGDGRTVRLTTSEQLGGQTYQVTCSNVEDTAGNIIGAANNKASFQGVGVPPRASVAVAVDSTHVDVSFTEPLDALAAVVLSHYGFSPALTVTAAVLQPDGLTVRLTTSEQTNGVSYTVTVTSIKDLVGNPIGGAGNTAVFTGIGRPPRVVSAIAVDSTHVDVLFDEALAVGTANTAANYSLDPALTVTGATLDANGTTVHLVTAEQNDGTSYTVTAGGGVKDLAGNSVASPNDTAAFTGIGVAPQIVSVTVVDAHKVRVVFSEAVGSSALNPGSYDITPGLSVLSSTREDAATLLLETSAYQVQDEVYTLSAPGVKDLAGNACADSKQFTGVGPITLSGLQVSQVGGAAGSNLGVYRYQVTYAHLGGTAPQSVSLTIKKPDASEMGTFAMAKVNPADNAYITGVVYEWHSSVLTGDTGIYAFQVDATDGAYAAAPATGSGPTVTVCESDRIAFVSDRDGNSEVYLMNADGSGQANITSTADPENDPAWSPDGNRIAFNAAPGGLDAIFVMNADGSGKTQVGPTGNGERNPCWSPDGSKIAYRSSASGDYEIYVMNADGTAPTRLTNVAGDDIEPAWSSTGKIAFRSNRDGNWEIYSMNADGTGQTRLTTDAAAEMAPAWSPDGSKIAFMSDRDGNYEIYVMSADGSSQTNVTRTAGEGEWNPSWSADGSKIVFHSDGDGRIYVMNMDGTGRTPLTAVGATNYDPAWAAGPRTPVPHSASIASDRQILMADGSAQATITVTVRDGGYLPFAGATVNFTTDQGTITTSADTNASGQATAIFTAGTTTGTATITATVSGGKNPACQAAVSLVPPGRVAFQTNRDNDYEIYDMNSDGTDQRRLTTSAGEDLAPCYSPDGRRIAFESCRDGNYEIYVMNADGTGQARLTNNTASDFAPAWSPNGAWIAYQSDRDGDDEIYVMDPNGNRDRRLTTSSGSDTRPTWSPDGSRIAFQSDRNGDNEIYVMSADGSGVVNLTNSPSTPDEEPAWSPDGSKIAFAAGTENSRDIYLVDVATPTNITRLTSDPANDDSPTWSPDGEWLMFHSDRDDADSIRVLRVSDPSRQFRVVSGRDPQWSALPETPSPYSLTLAADKGMLQAGGSATTTVTATVHDGSYWPLEGASVAFSATTGSFDASPVNTNASGVAAATYTPGPTVGIATLTATASGGKSPTARMEVDLVAGRIAFTTNTGIFAVDAGGGTPARVAGSGYTNQNPAWSPDGRRIVYTSDAGDDFRLWTVDESGSNAAELLADRNGVQPRWSPDGTRIVFSSNSAGPDDLFVVNADGTNVKQLTSDPESDQKPSWSPDGKRIVWERVLAEGSEIYVMNADGTDRKRLTYNTVSEHSPVFSPDGMKIAFVVETDNTWRIWMMNADGSGRTRVSDEAAMYDEDPAWSPDGQYLAFTRDTGDNPEIFIMRADGSRATPIVESPGLECQPVWSVPPEAPSPYSVTLVPDKKIVMTNGTCGVSATVRDGSYQPVVGQEVSFTASAGSLDNATATTVTGGVATVTLTAPATAGTADLTATVSAGKNPVGQAKARFVGQGKIAFTSGRDNNYEVYTMDPDGANQTRLTDNTTFIDSNPSWSPDGTKLAFASDRDGNPEIYVMDADGGHLTRLTFTGGADGVPAWSPDGSKIAFASMRDGNQEIYVMNPDGSGQTRLTTASGVDTNPAWSPDGSKIAFVTQRDGNREVYVMNADGSDPVNLTNSPDAYEDFPAWSPDGSKIAFDFNPSSNTDVHVMNADGSNPTPLVTNPAMDSQANWSPDGSKVTFTSSRDGNSEVYVMDADGSNQTRVTNNYPLGNLDSHWSSGLGEGAYSAMLAAGAPVIRADGSSTVAVTVTVRGGHGEPRAGENVSFTADPGTLSATSGTTDANGQVTVTLTSSTSVGPATVAAMTDGPRGKVVATARVHFCGAGRIAFVGSNNFSVNGLFTVLPDGSDLLHLSTNTVVIADPAWSPDGTKIAYTDSSNVWVINYDGTNPVQLTADGSNSSPSWSPDGSVIVYAHYGGTVTDLYTVPSAGGTPVLLAHEDGFNLSGPAWSPDGSRILYTRSAHPSGDPCDIWVMDADGSNPTQLTSAAGADQMPAWSPDGSKIVFISNRDAGGMGEVYVMDADGGNQRRLTTNDSVDYAPAFSADGTQIVYSNSRSGLHKLFMVKADGSQSDGTQFTISGHSDVQTDPCWSRGTDPATGRVPGRPRTKTRNARLRAFCNGQEAFALLTPAGIVPEGRSDSLITTGDGRRETGDRAPGSTRDPGAGATAATPATGLRFVALSADEARSASGLRSPVSGRSWPFAIEAPDANAEVTLSWPDLSGLGAKDRIILEDLDGGKRRSMRTTAAYTFRATDATRRRFQVTADPRQGPAVLVTGLQLLGADGGTRAPGNALRLIAFNISTEAVVNIRLVAPAGKEVAVLARGYAAVTGRNQLSWRGMLQPGLYLMEATATTDDGSAVKAVQPVVVVR